MGLIKRYEFIFTAILVLFILSILAQVYILEPEYRNTILPVFTAILAGLGIHEITKRG